MDNQLKDFVHAFILRNSLFTRALLRLLIQRLVNVQLQRVPNRIPLKIGQQSLLSLTARPPDFYNEYCMSVPCFWDLHDTLQESSGLQGSEEVESYEALGIFLSLCGHTDTQRRLGRLYQHSPASINYYYKVVLDAICSMAKDILNPNDPTFPTVSRYLDAHPQFHGAIGAIDGTHIPAIPPRNSRGYYLGRKGEPTQNVLVVCDFDMHFTHVYAGTPGSQHDSRVLHYTMSMPAVNFPHPPAGKYYLVDSGYSNTAGFLAPFKNVAYHHMDFDTVSPRGKEERFNYIHAKLRNIIERTIGVWKKKWPIMKHMWEYKWPIQVKLVILTATLRNFIRDHDRVNADICDANSGGYVRLEDDDDNDNEVSGQQGSYAADMNSLRDSIANSIPTSVIRSQASRRR